MQFDNLSEFFAMGGYAFYVWLSFGVTVITMAAIALSSYRANKKLLNEVVKEQQRLARVKKARQATSSTPL